MTGLYVERGRLIHAPCECSEWCKLFLKAATAAEGMQEALRQYPSDNLGMDSLGIDEAPCPGMLMSRCI